MASYNYTTANGTVYRSDGNCIQDDESIPPWCLVVEKSCSQPPPKKPNGQAYDICRGAMPWTLYFVAPDTVSDELDHLCMFHMCGFSSFTAVLTDYEFRCSMMLCCVTQQPKALRVYLSCINRHGL